MRADLHSPIRPAAGRRPTARQDSVSPGAVLEEIGLLLVLHLWVALSVSVALDLWRSS